MHKEEDLQNKEEQPLLAEVKLNVQKLDDQLTHSNTNSIQSENTKKSRYRTFVDFTKGPILLILFIAFSSIFVIQPDREDIELVPLSSTFNVTIPLPKKERRSHLELDLSVPDQIDVRYEVELTSNVFVFLQTAFHENSTWETVFNETLKVNFNVTNRKNRERFIIKYPDGTEKYEMQVLLTTDSRLPLPLRIISSQQTFLIEYEVLLAAFVFCGVYFLIIFEILPRPVAGLLGAMVCLAVMGLLNHRPTLKEVAGFVNWEAMCLVTGMMVVFGLFKTTGIFEYCALLAYKASRGKLWPLMCILCLFCFFISIILDNVTLMLLMTPVTVQLCEVIGISPIPLLIAECLFGNIGGAGTPLGEEYVIILQHPGMKAHNVNFASSFLYLFPGSFIVALTSLLPIYFLNWGLFRKKSQVSPEKLEIQKKIRIWKDTLRRLKPIGPEERTVRDKLKNYISELHKELEALDKKSSNIDLDALEKRYKIHDKVLFTKCFAVLVIVLSLFFLESVLNQVINISLPWIALVGATSLMLLAMNTVNVEEIIEDIEWPTLLFLVTLFILIEGLDRMGLIEAIGNGIQAVISVITPQLRLTAAITLLLWVSAIISSFIGNVPYITAMTPVLLKLASPPLNIPVLPMLFALTNGVSLGGSATIVGASGNIIVSDLSKKRGYFISFWRWFKTGTPFMIANIAVINVYLLIVHVWWNIGTNASPIQPQYPPPGGW